MTYCCGILVREGLVMIADTRTNAGLDNVSTFRKLHVFENAGERSIAIASAGNLSLTQGVLAFLREGLLNEATGEIETLQNAPTMFQATQRIGHAIREMRRIHGDDFERDGLKFEMSLLFGGQIRGGPLQLYMIYAAGNSIQCTQDTPYLQIGEHKYGKPILDRAITFDTNLRDSLKIGLISMDSTMRSNLGVGMPIDILVVPLDSCAASIRQRIEPGEPYFHDLRERWSAALRRAHIAIPEPPYSGTSPIGK